VNTYKNYIFHLNFILYFQGVTMRLFLVLICGLLMSHVAYSKSINLTFNGAIIEPTCEIFVEQNQYCNSIMSSENDEGKKFKIEDLSLDHINNFIESNPSKNLKISINQYNKEKNTVNLSVVYK
jgi:type 1 fimbria pilin